MKKTIPFILLSLLIAAPSFAVLNWASESGFILKDALGTPLPNAGANGSLTGAMVQLILDVNKDGILLDPNSPNGVSGDDHVIDVAWIGSGGIGAGSPGVLRQQVGEKSPTTGSHVYVRIWNAPAGESYGIYDGNESAKIPLLNSGLNVLGTPLYYGDSGLYVTTGPDNNIGIEDMYFRATANQLFPGAVPEAGTAGLAGLGLLMLRRIMRKRMS